MIERVPATVEHFERFGAGKLPPRTVRAWSVLEDDQVLAIAGYYPDQGRLVAFAGIDPQAKARAGYAMTLYRCARDILREIARERMPVHALPDPEIAGSERLLRHLGFHHEYKDVWSWDG